MKNLINDKNIDFCSNFKQSVLFSNILKNCFGPFFRKSSHCETWQPRPADVQTLFPSLRLYMKKSQKDKLAFMVKKFANRKRLQNFGLTKSLIQLKRKSQTLKSIQLIQVFFKYFFRRSNLF